MTLRVNSPRGVIERYFDHLPVSRATPVVSLGEGDTPSVFSALLSRRTGADVWLKCEGLNPTGSFKDRGMTVAVSKALEDRARAVVCASTGNTSASAAAYAARAGLVCGVLIPRGKVALGKLAQALVHGARVLEIEGDFDRALELTRVIADTGRVTIVNSVNPYRIEGQKTGAFEIVHALGRAPDLHLMPVGNAGNITAYWRGYREALDAGWCTNSPRMFGFQAEGAAPIVTRKVVRRPRTVASAIRIGNPASWRTAEEAARESQGAIHAVSDEAIVEAHRLLASEGIFVELASAAAIAGLLTIAEAGVVPPGATVACVLTGHGLKDPRWAIESARAPRVVPPDSGSILEALDLG